MDIISSTQDQHSFAEPEFARVIKTHLELTVDFNRKVLDGRAILTVQRKNLIVKEIILDNYELVIKSVRNCSDNSPRHDLNYEIGLHHAIGSSFKIQLPEKLELAYRPTCKIEIEYETRPNCPALYWLTPEQTADGEYPFLLSYNKSIYARSMFPCQDTPSVKFSYTAKISVLKGFTVLMSALLIKKSEKQQLDVYEFVQPKPIPSFAMIIAVGSLQKRQLNPRCDIYAENKFIVDSLNTFRSGPIENMLRIAEDLFGTYFWDRYDLCVLPPSTSHFEIEGPCITFLSPILLRGDRSCICSLSLNISQSWAGILVTCANYNHLWLNRSFSVFLSRKIISKVLVHPDIRLLYKRSLLQDLTVRIQTFRPVNLLKYLLSDLGDSLPHEVIKYVPYEVGCILLDRLENVLGGSSVFEPFLKSYFYKFAYRSICTKDWLDYLYEYFPEKHEVLHEMSWNSWLFDAVPLPIIPRMSVWEAECNDLVQEWVKWDAEGYNLPFPLVQERNFCDLQKALLLSSLQVYHKFLTEKKMQLISNIYSFNNHNHNGQIRHSWLLLCIKARWMQGVLESLGFAFQFGGPNYINPLFEELYKWKATRHIAIDLYLKNKKKLLDETQRKLDRILYLN